MAAVLTVTTIGETNAFELPRVKPHERGLKCVGAQTHGGHPLGSIGAIPVGFLAHIAHPMPIAESIR